MANGTREDVETIDDNDPRCQWPTTAQAKKKLGVHGRTIENMIRRGDLRYVYGPNSERHFNPEDLDSQADVPVTTQAIEADTEAHTITVLKGMVKDLARSNAELLKLATDPAKSFVTMMTDQLDRANKHNLELQAKYIQGLEAFELALNSKHDRDLQTKKQESHDKRLDQALDKALEQLPAIVAGLSAKKAVSGFLETLTSDQKGLLFDMLTPQQVAVLVKVFGKHFNQSNGASGPSESGDANTEGEKPS